MKASMRYLNIYLIKFKQSYRDNKKKCKEHGKDNSWNFLFLLKDNNSKDLRRAMLASKDKRMHI